MIPLFKWGKYLNKSLESEGLPPKPYISIIFNFCKNSIIFWIFDEILIFSFDCPWKYWNSLPQNNSHGFIRPLDLDCHEIFCWRYFIFSEIILKYDLFLFFPKPFHFFSKSFWTYLCDIRVDSIFSGPLKFARRHDSYEIVVKS